MYRIKDIQDSFCTLIGWRDEWSNLDIDDELKISDSGLYYQDSHPLLTLANINSVTPVFSESVPGWSANIPYKAGDIVLPSTIFYIALVDNQGVGPGSDPEVWGLYSPLSDWICRKTQSVIVEVVRKVWDSKLKNKTAKNLLENKPLFTGAGRYKNTITNTQSWVGFELIMNRSNGVVTKINKLSLQLDGSVDLKVFLYHSSNDEPVAEFQLSYDTPNKVKWFDISEHLYAVSDNTDEGGSYYLVYNQQDLEDAGVQAINKDKDWSKKPCCSTSEIQTYITYSKYLEIHPFKVGALGNSSASSLLWDIKDNVYYDSTNFGLNLQISVMCDPTDLIIQHRDSFQNLLLLQMASTMLREFVYNPNFRIGRTQQNFNRQEILYELDGDSTSEKKSGINYRLNEALDAIKIDMTSMSKVCFPCNNKGLRYKPT